MQHKRRIALSVLIPIAILKGLTGVAADGAQVPFFQDFEALSQGSIDGRDGWSVAMGEAAVVVGSARFGEKALQIEGSSEVALDVESGQTVLWVQMWVRTQGGPIVPSIPPLPAKSAVIVFDCVEGIQALDGDGMGGGTIRNSGVVLDAAAWYRINLRLDFEAKRWDLYVDGQNSLPGLGFHSNDVAGLSGMVRTSNDRGYMDTLSFGDLGPTEDSDQDGLCDLDEIQIYGTNPLLRDTDGDGMGDGDEIIAGTEPTDSQSLLYLNIAGQDGTEALQLSAPTVEGKTYELQATEDVGDPASWQPLADFVGDGEAWTWIVSDDLSGAKRFYRLAVLPQ